MKHIIAVMLLFFSFGASALNLNIGYPVSAARLGLSGSIEFFVYCSNKDLQIIESSNELFSRHVRKNVSVICYRDNARHEVKIDFKKDEFNQNMISRQPSRYFKP